MKLVNKIKIYLTTGLIAPFVSQCNLENSGPKIEKPKPTTESLAYLAYKNRTDANTINHKNQELRVLFGDEWAI